MKQFYRVWFDGPAGKTAVLVVDTVAFPPQSTTVTEYSRLFPYSEARKMTRIYVGPIRPTFEEAFREEPSI